MLIPVPPLNFLLLNVNAVFPDDAGIFDYILVPAEVFTLESEVMGIRLESATKMSTWMKRCLPPTSLLAYCLGRLHRMGWSCHGGTRGH